jgi:uncharacterized repeat protein (TIGR03803 family)
LNHWGTVFSLRQDGSGYRVLYSFGSFPGDGGTPWGGLIQGSDTALYGVTADVTFGFSLDLYGTLFKLNPDGSGYRLLFTFPSAAGDGPQPLGVTAGNGGALYGVTTTSEPNQPGAVFKLNPDGSGYSVLRKFSATGGDGQVPIADLIQGSDGVLYGTTALGDANQAGTVFKLNADGSGYTILHDFNLAPDDGQGPYSGLVEGRDGMLYGTTYSDGTDYAGVVFKLKKDGTSYNVLHRFTNTLGDGAMPYAGLIQASDGVFYGTTTGGGSNYVGTVFKINGDGSGYRVLYSFGNGATDGQNPAARLLEASDGILYGTSTGSGGCFSGYGCGTVFKLNKDGSGYAILHTFGATLDGAQPNCALVEGADGALYGTTESTSYFVNLGTVFKLNKDGTGYTVLHIFDRGGGDAAMPAAGLAKGSDGALYGTTQSGGANSAGPYTGAGAVFRLGSDGVDYSVLYSFDYSSGDGHNPVAALVQGSDGAFYGTTPVGGDSGLGTVFRLCLAQPHILCPTNVTAEFTATSGAAVSFAPSASGGCGETPVVSCTPLSGSTFPIGTATVLCTATDAASNSATCSFQVTVLGARGVKQNVLAELTALQSNLSLAAKGYGRELNEAIRFLAASLNAMYWVDETHLQPLKGSRSMQEEAMAAEELEGIMRSSHGPLNYTVLQGLVHRIVKSDRLLAVVSIEDAVRAGLNAQEIQEALH